MEGGIVGGDVGEGVACLDGAVGRGGGQGEGVGMGGEAGCVFVGHPYLSTTMGIDAVFVEESHAGVGGETDGVVGGRDGGLESQGGVGEAVGCEEIVVIVRVCVNNVFKPLVGGNVAPCVGCFAIEEQVVVVVEETVVVMVDDLNGSGCEVVGMGSRVAGGKHVAGCAVETDVVAGYVGKSGNQLSCDFVDTGGGNGYFVPLA